MSDLHKRKLTIPQILAQVVFDVDQKLNYTLHNRARWFAIGDRYELVYVDKYVIHNNEKKKWVEIIRMNGKPWTEPVILKDGFTSLAQALSSSQNIGFKLKDISWFLYHGMQSFLQRQHQHLNPKNDDHKSPNDYDQSISEQKLHRSQSSYSSLLSSMQQEYEQKVIEIEREQQQHHTMLVEENQFLRQQLKQKSDELVQIQLKYNPMIENLNALLKEKDKAIETQKKRATEAFEQSEVTYAERDNLKLKLLEKDQVIQHLQKQADDEKQSSDRDAFQDSLVEIKLGYQQRIQQLKQEHKQNIAQLNHKIRDCMEIINNTSNKQVINIHHENNEFKKQKKKTLNEKDDDYVIDNWTRETILDIVQIDGNNDD